MEQKSFYSGIKVQSPSKCITTIPAIPALPASYSTLFHNTPILYLFPKNLQYSQYSTYSPKNLQYSQYSTYSPKILQYSQYSTYSQKILQYSQYSTYSNTIQYSTYSQKILRLIYYSSIPTLPIPKNYQKECTLRNG